MNSFKAVAIFTYMFSTLSSSIEGDSRSSRHKRYAAFPDGSTLSIALCMSMSAIAPGTIFTEGVNWGIAYELPNRTTYLESYKLKKQVVRRRHRRQLYNSLETILETMGYDGKGCIYRALCEAPRKLFPKQGTVLEEILRLVLSFPQKHLSEDEPEEHRLYHWAYRQGKVGRKQSCSELFPDCPFSLVDMALGAYDDD